MKNVELQLLVNGKPVPTYGHDGRTFVEGREGTNFSLRVKNNTASRIEALVSVDGRSVVDGESAGPTSRGYIIPAYGSYEIPGWRVDTENCAKFIFKKSGESYAVQTGSAASDTGVIGLLAWAEKIVPPPAPSVVIQQTIIKEPIWTWIPYYHGTYAASTAAGNAHTSSLGNSVSYTTCSNSLSSAPLRSMSLDSSSVANQSILGAQVQPTSAYYSAAAPSFDLGAGWGDQAASKISFTSFERGDQIVEQTLYYATAQALENVGIKLKKEVAVPTGESSPKYPSAFKFCKPPVK